MTPRLAPHSKAAKEQNSWRLSRSARACEKRSQNRALTMTTNSQNLLWPAVLCDFATTSLLFVLPRQDRAVKGAVPHCSRCALVVRPAAMKRGAS